MEQRQNARAGETGDPRETRRPVTWSGTIPKCENPGATPPRIEAGSPRWKASSLTTTPPRPSEIRGDSSESVVSSERSNRGVATHAVMPMADTSSIACDVANRGASCTGKRDWGRIGKESAMAFVRDPSQHSPGVISENHGKPKSGWPDRELNPAGTPRTPGITLREWLAVRADDSEARTAYVFTLGHLAGDKAVRCMGSRIYKPSGTFDKREPTASEHPLRRAEDCRARPKRDEASRSLPAAQAACRRNNVLYTAGLETNPPSRRVHGLRDVSQLHRQTSDAVWRGAGMKGQGKREIPEKARRPTSGMIPTCENPVTRPGIEPGSPWWEASCYREQPALMSSTAKIPSTRRPHDLSCPARESLEHGADVSEGAALARGVNTAGEPARHRARITPRPSLTLLELLPSLRNTHHLSLLRGLCVTLARRQAILLRLRRRSTLASVSRSASIPGLLACMPGGRAHDFTLEPKLHDTCSRTWFLYNLLQGIVHEPTSYRNQERVYGTLSEFSVSSPSSFSCVSTLHLVCLSEWSGAIWAGLNVELLRTDTGETSGAGMQGQGKRETPLRETPPTRGIVRHDSNTKYSGVTPPRLGSAGGTARSHSCGLSAEPARTYLGSVDWRVHPPHEPACLARVYPRWGQEPMSGNASLYQVTVIPTSRISRQPGGNLAV
ncbi:hypothetical protein PR048_002936 [Dryococelus australis]|uniref:Uncharacterized protein n=1 Tax=Dryococelus australis TaxID=614101 RepID=A0ABQ9ILN6_9NEOP|nr:hypothetical protein PR048_002936 [Dryococelus australis]